MVQADPQLKDVIWSDLGIQYVGNGIIDVKANPQSTNYTGEADVNVATEIDPSSANPTLSNVGDTVLITAELGQLDSSSYV
ncbi:hypothetical protein FACS1894166_12910 [Bacilli bacterium]|nr:hypothetical protein FACS1894166_12910 [Bacilli bacterium]